MKIEFQENPNLADDELRLLVEAAEKNQQVVQLLHYLDQYQKKNLDLVSIKTIDDIQLIKTETIIYIDVDGDELKIYTKSQIITTKERLTHFLERVDANKFIQVSKHAAINFEQLLSLSNSFSGNMTAILTNNQKTTVSRRYVKNLLNRLGL